MRLLRLLTAVLLTTQLFSTHNTVAFENTHTYQPIQPKVQLGSRPLALINEMDKSPLKATLEGCKNHRFTPSKFSIGHRGAPMRYPEHTKESYLAAAKMGAGIVECDITFTKDRQLVCRHSQCDLHATTNILETPLAQKCAVAPEFDNSGTLINAYVIECCTTDITEAEFKTLEGKKQSANTHATNIAEYMKTTAEGHSDADLRRGTVMTHAESIKLLDRLGVDFIPELKAPKVEMPYEGGYSQQDYALQMINEYRTAGIHPKRVWPQSFNYDDVIYWINHTPLFGKQAVYLDDSYDLNISVKHMETWVDDGLKVLSPPLWILLDVHENGQIMSSQYALNARKAGLTLMTWTLERSGSLKNNGGWFYQTLNGERGNIDVIHNDGDIYEVLDVLAREVGVVGVFSDWPATTTYYANCMGL